MTFVLDASVTMAWCFLDEVTPYTEAVFERLRETDASVPAIWPLEVANALRGGMRRQRLSESWRAEFAARLRALPIEVEPVSLERALGPVLDLARDQGLSAYDAAYLELALRLGAPLATQDAVLGAAAGRVGVEVL